VAQLAVAGIRLLGGSEAREHPHRPEPAAIARWVDATGERVLARVREVARIIESGDVHRAVETLNRESGRRHERTRTLDAIGGDACLPGVTLGSDSLGVALAHTLICS